MINKLKRKRKENLINPFFVSRHSIDQVISTCVEGESSFFFPSKAADKIACPEIPTDTPRSNI